MTVELTSDVQTNPLIVTVETLNTGTATGECMQWKHQTFTTLTMEPTDLLLNKEQNHLDCRV